MIPPRSAPQETLYRCSLPIDGDADAARAFESARTALLDWADVFARERLGTPLDDASGIQTAVAFEIAHGPASLRIIDSDVASDVSPFGLAYAYEEHGTLRRGEVTLSAAGDVPRLGERVYGRFGEGYAEPLATRFLAARGLIADAGTPLTGEAVAIEDDAAVGAVWKLLSSPERRLPLVIVSEPYLLDARALASRLHGVAHVRTIANRMTFVLRGIGGRELAVFGGAVRVYGAVGSAESYVVLAATLAAAAHAGRADDLVLAHVYRYATEMAAREPAISLADVQRLLEHDAAMAAIAMQTPPPQATPGAPRPQMETAAVDAAPPGLRDRTPEIVEPSPEIVELRATVEQLRSDLDARETELLAALDDLDRERRARTSAAASGDGAHEPAAALHPTLQNFVTAIQLLTEATHAIQSELETLRSEADSAVAETLRLRRRLGRREANLPAEAPIRPATLDPDVVEPWVEARFGDRLELHSRALAALAIAQYDEPEDVVAALELLGDAYHAMRVRSPEDDAPRIAWEDALRASGLRLSGAISDREFGKHRRLYTVPYGGRDCRLELHLRNGSGTTDPRRALRVYFFWDDVAKRVIVGSLPGHLPNSLS